MKTDTKQLIIIWLAAILSGAACAWYINHSINQLCQQNMAERGVLYGK